MKIYFVLITLIFLNACSALCQTLKNKEVAFLIDTTISIMKNNAVNAGNVNWDSLKRNSLDQAANFNSPYELGNVIRSVFKTIDDFHGKFFYKDSTFQWQGRKLIISDSVKNEWNKSSGIKTEILNENIGYLRIPSISYGGRAGDDKKAQELNDSLCTILSSNVKGLIVDLRIDGGGSMFPMIMGIRQLLGERKLGAFQGTPKQEWIINDNRFLLDAAVMAAISPKCAIDAQAIPCVLLVGPGTGSSGEFLTIALKGRKNTVLIGEETAGYVTSIRGFQIKNFANIYLSVGYAQDSNGNGYTKAIQPDVKLSMADNFNSVKDDGKVKYAIDWINKHPK